MKNSGTIVATSAQPIAHHAPGNGHVMCDEKNEVTKKMEHRQLHSPKYVKSMKNMLAESTRNRLSKKPELTLKEAVLAAIPSFPDWYSPELFIQALTAITAEWQRCRAELSIA